LIVSLSLLFVTSSSAAAGVFLSFSLTQNQILKISQEILLQQQVSSRIFNYNSRSLFFKIRVLVVGF
ncbi:Ras-related protein Rab-34, partial [Bienertia sinuspersici]